MYMYVFMNRNMFLVCIFVCSYHIRIVLFTYTIHSL